jgi:hypothetical protein
VDRAGAFVLDCAVGDRLERAGVVDADTAIDADERSAGSQAVAADGLVLARAPAREALRGSVAPNTLF